MKEIDEDESIVITVILPTWFHPVMRSMTKYDPITGFSYRIDPQNDGASTKRHIHIWKKRNPNKEVSWNIDGTRHDKGNFDENIEGFKHAKSLAKRILKTDPGVCFNLHQNIILHEMNDHLISLLSYTLLNDSAIKSITIDYHS
ncbi:TPA: DUF6367 family protein [Salmonella enterica subsp. enterica serovar Weltevreden]|nr:DUF6367 family protein [Citrobacter freundii]EDY6161828.1 hypothetical protein [Salmonella enterica subsp. enterica serovar Senftenberg]MHV60785.1 hypothetical protein [Escherichia coli]HEC6891081.1 hypothetical protein [Salmonella enterica subsp. enterica serovar Weltevreden]EKA2135609.1 hypothetical protein [Citrobacter freundii]MBJ8975080.1 hypothetical protein [Citrobacter freundii]